jgi:hypothetical protein
MDATSLFRSVLPRLAIRDKKFLQPYVDLVSFPGLFVEGKTNNHHVLPKSMAVDLGIPAKEYNDPEINIVNMEVRDHVLAHYYLHKLFGGKMTYAFHHFTKSIPGWQNYGLNNVLDEISKSIKYYQKITSQMRRGKKLNIASFVDAIPPLDAENIFRDGQNKSVRILGDQLLIKRIPQNTLDKRYLGRRVYVNKETGEHKKDFRSLTGINNEDKEWREVPTWRDKKYRHRVHEILSCPWCGYTGEVPGILSFHFDFCKKNPNAIPRREHIDIKYQETLGNLTTANAAKATNMSVPQFTRLGKRLFINKKIPRGNIVFWSNYEVEMIRWYKQLTTKERRDPNVFLRNNVPQANVELKQTYIKKITGG